MSKEIRGRDQFARYKKIIDTLVNIYRVLPLKMRLKVFEKRRNTKGKMGLGIRYALLKSLALECGDNVAIYPGAYIMNPQSMCIGDNVSIHPMCYLESGNTSGCGIRIGNDVSLAHGVTIMATSHKFDDISIPIRDQGVAINMVEIRDNVWVGAKASILSGCTIASGCIVGANSVVTKDTEPNGIYVGAPARKIKER